MADKTLPASPKNPYGTYPGNKTDEDINGEKEQIRRDRPTVSVRRHSQVI